MLLCILLFILIPTSHCQYFSYLSLRFRLPGRCGLGDFDCGFGHCVPVTRFHDGRPDCPDGSDEWCFIGQVKCGPYCVALHDALGCVFNSKCDGSTKQPYWCTNSNKNVCSEPAFFPCKGYGECVRWSWLMDGTKHCIDNSDEDLEYIRTLEGPLRCYYNQTGQPQPPEGLQLFPPPVPVIIPAPIPVAPVVVQPPPPPCIQCQPNFQTPFPNVIIPEKQEIPNYPFDNTNSDRNPFLAIATIAGQQQRATVPTQGVFKSGNTVPPVYFVFPTMTTTTHVPTSTSEPAETKQTSLTSPEKSEGTTEDPFASVDIGNFFPEDDNTGSHSTKISTTADTNEILVAKVTSNAKPTPTSTLVEEETTTGASQRPPIQETAHIDIKTGKVSGAKHFDTTTVSPETTTEDLTTTSKNLDADEADSLFFRPRPIIPVIRPPDRIITPIVPNYENQQRGNQPSWNEQALVPIIPGLIPPTPPYQWNTRRPIIVFPPVTQPPVLPLEPYQPTPPFPTYGSYSRPATIKPSRPTEPTYETEPIVTESDKSETTIKISTSTEEGKTVDTVNPSTETPAESTESSDNNHSTNPEDVATTTTDSPAVTTTSHIKIIPSLSPQESAKAEQNECMMKLMEHLKTKFPEPICSCDKGQMKLSGECEVGNTTIFKMNVNKVCGSSDIEKEDRPYIALSKMQDLTKNPACIRWSSDDDVVVNVLCNDCDVKHYQNLLGSQIGQHDNLSIEALNSTLCSDYRLNDCPWNAQCLVDGHGTSFSCRCKNGTADLSNGTGKLCDGVPDDEICALFLGICVITWLIFVLGGLFILLLLCLLCFRLRSLLKQNTIQPETSKVAFQENRKHGVRRNGRFIEQTPHLKDVMKKTLGNSALGASSFAKSFAAITALAPKPGTPLTRPSSNKTIQIELPRENSFVDDKRSVPNEPVGLRPETPQPANKRESTAITIETPILSGSNNNITSNGVNIETFAVPQRPSTIATERKLKETATVLDLTKTTPPPELHSSESAPSLPNLPLPFPLPVASQTTVAEVYPEPEVAKETKEVVTSSHDGQPTMWQTFKVLGGNYNAPEQIERQGSSGSLEALINARFPEAILAAQAKENEKIATPVPELVPQPVSQPMPMYVPEPVPSPTPSLTPEKQTLPETVPSPPSPEELRPVDMSRIPPLGHISLTDDTSLASAIAAEEEIVNGQPESTQSTANLKLAEMLGVKLDAIVDSGIKDKNDERALEEMASDHITLPNPLEDLTPKFIVGSDSPPTGDTSQMSLSQALSTDVPSVSQEATPSVNQVEGMLNPETQTNITILKEPETLKPEGPTAKKEERKTKPSNIITEMKREERIITRTTTKRDKSKENVGAKPGAKPGSSQKSKDSKTKTTTPVEPTSVKTRVFVPKGAKEREEKSRKEKMNLAKRMKVPLRETKKVVHKKEMLTSEEESDPEVAAVKQMEKLGGRLEPQSHSQKKGRPPERQLSSISEKSSEIASDARIEEAHSQIDYSISAPTTTRHPSDWHGLRGMHELEVGRSDVDSDSMQDVDIPKMEGLPDKLVSSPDIPDVTTARSTERIEFALGGMPNQSRWLSKESVASTSSKQTKGRFSHGSKASLAVDDDIPSTSRSHRTVIGRKIASRRQEVFTSQSERNSDIGMEVTATGLYFNSRKARSQDNLLRHQPPWNAQSKRESTRESFLPLLSKRSRSLFSVPHHPHKRRISTHSYQSGIGSRGGSSADLSPIFNEGDYNKPPKEELWWGAPLR